MAAAVDVQTVNITIDGTPMAVPKGEMVVESIKRLGLEIPIFCYHPRMKPVGMCRMCLIEIGTKGPDGSVRMMPKPQTACSLPATEGLVVVTDSEKIHQDRKGVLEFLLINHPLDCPICDRGGECPLQNNTLFYGPSTSRFIEAKRHAPKAFPLSKYVTLDLERCIQCGRCVRFTEEISGDAQLAFRFRGAAMQPSTFEMRDFSSKFSGNVIEICPVGALTNATYRFRARPWDLETRKGICTNCSNGCNIYIDHREQTLVRVNARTNEQVNEEWTCDRGKFGHGYYNSESRLRKVLVREGSSLAPSSWSAAYSRILERFLSSEAESGLIGGSTNSNEDLYAMGRLFGALPGCKVSYFGDLDVPMVSANLRRPTPIADWESKQSILVFGSSLADEEPILYLRVRKSWVRNEARVVVASSADTDVDGFAALVLRYRAGTESAVAAGLLAAFEGASEKDERLRSVETATDVLAAYFVEAAALLKSDNSGLIATHGLYRSESGPQAAESLRQIAERMQGASDCYPLASNGAGALLFAKGAKNLASTSEILKGCVSGRIKSLWVVGDELLRFADQDLVQSALENVEFLVIQDVQETELTSYASVVLPMCAPAEVDGSWTNIENRVQRMIPVFQPKGEAKPMSGVCAELGLQSKAANLPFDRQGLFSLLASGVPGMDGVTLHAIPDEGVLVG